MRRPILVRNLNCTRSVAPARIRAVAQRTATLVRLPPAIAFEIIIVTNRRIRSFNRTFTGRDATTDVLSFRVAPVPGAPVRLRDTIIIIISSDKACQNARRFSVGPGEELARYVIHGILHQAGYDDRTAAARRRMRAMEDRILCQLSGKISWSKVLTRR